MATDFFSIHDKATIAAFLRKRTDLHIYEIGDLDEFFWPHTLWFADAPDQQMSALCLLYVGQSQPTLLALGDPAPLVALIRSLSGLLPNWFYAHVSPGVEAAFDKVFQLEPHGNHLKMSLKNPTRLLGTDAPRAVRLGPEDLGEVLQLYRESYPGNWFDPRMLETREYFGIREGPRLLSIAGIHVFSPAFRVAALGNITTHPDFRAKGLGKQVTKELCLSLLKQVDHVGLNVAADNQPAISCYRKLGFEIVAQYREFGVSRTA